MLTCAQSTCGCSHVPTCAHMCSHVPRLLGTCGAHMWVLTCAQIMFRFSSNRGQSSWECVATVTIICTSNILTEEGMSSILSPLFFYINVFVVFGSLLLTHLLISLSFTPYPFVSRPAPPVTPSDSVVRRSISQQKSGMSVTIDDAAAAPAPRQPSPPRGKLSAIVHVSNLVSW